MLCYSESISEKGERCQIINFSKIKFQCCRAVVILSRHRFSATVTGHLSTHTLISTFIETKMLSDEAETVVLNVTCYGFTQRVLMSMFLKLNRAMDLITV